MGKNFLKTLQQAEFEKKNPEVFELYNHLPEFDTKILGDKEKKTFVTDKFAF